MKKDSLPECRLCRVKRLNKRQQQIHKGICAREAARVGWTKTVNDPLYADRMAVVEASLAFHAAYHSIPPRSSVTERYAWDASIAALRTAERAKKKGKP